MSRILVTSDKKGTNGKKSKKISREVKEQELDKLKNADELNEDEFLAQKDKLEDEIENSEKEYNYSESSEEIQDSDHEEARKKTKKPQQEFQLVEFQFPSTMIKTQGKNRLQWDILIIIFSVYQAITIPLDIAFHPDFFNSP